MGQETAREDFGEAMHRAQLSLLLFLERFSEGTSTSVFSFSTASSDPRVAQRGHSE